MCDGYQAPSSTTSPTKPAEKPLPTPTPPPASTPVPTDADDENSCDSVTVKIKGKRGRPKKNPSKEVTSMEISETIAEIHSTDTDQDGPDSTVKNETSEAISPRAKRRRRLAEVKEESPLPETPTVAKKKDGRGRPRKNPIKVPETPPTDESSIQSTNDIVNEDSMDAPSTSGARIGRPRKHALISRDTETPKRMKKDSLTPPESIDDSSQKESPENTKKARK